MPLYVYECAEHGRFDVLQRMSDEHKATCPKCGSNSKLVITSCNHRIATPIRWVTEDGTVLAEKPDSGIRPPPGLPYPAISQVGD